MREADRTESVSDQSFVCHDVDATYGAQIDISLRPGMAWALYSDDGPGGPCGQSMRITCPHAVLMTWASEEAMRTYMENKRWRNKKNRIMCGVVDEYTAGGVFRVVKFD